jgi:NTP pyrophosphatase (non-canonical NTP hydrolase)
MNVYQETANRTDQHPLAAGTKPTGPEVMVPLLGLAGEAGGLLTEYKKYLRDGESHRLFTERVAEELGDLLWYVANVATKFGLTLSDVAVGNVEKCRDRWGEVPAAALRDRRVLFDDRNDHREQLPRRFVFAIKKAARDGRVGIRVFIDGAEVETDLDELSDNAYEDDGYRFHDVFHLAYAAVLGWSPIIRSGLKRKRKSNHKTDEVEDGGRAKAIEEGVSALVFTYAAEHNFLDGAEGVSYDVLRVVKSMTAHLEVARASARDWERAIVRGYEVWRAVKARGGGAILADLEAGTIELVENPIVVPA